ncbi:MAG: YraN family protein [Dehalococcoidia bacterium]
MPSARTKLGDQGEAVARAHIESQGMRFVDRKFRTRSGEVDLIATEGGTVVFVEVKTRRGSAYGTPEESVTRSKARKLALTAQRYLQINGLEQADWRIDVIGITLNEGAPAVINHVRGIEVG